MQKQLKKQPRCQECEHRYSVLYNTPNGLRRQSYCKNTPGEGSYKFECVTPDKWCYNFKKKDNGL